MRRLRSLLMALVLAGVPVQAPRVLADIASDHPAAILVFPKLLVDTESGLDTLVRISNVSQQPLNVLCFYVNVTPQCTVEGGDCFPDRLTCGAEIRGQFYPGECLPQWQPTDFVFRLTREQPTGWLVSRGESINCRFLDGLCSNDGVTVCDRDSDCGAGNRCVQPPCLPLDGGPLGRTGPGGQVNEGAIPLSPDDPFIGELKCIAVDETLAPAARNDLIGEVLIGRVQDGPDAVDIDVAGYNAIGIPAIPGTGNRDDTLVIGGPAESAEYEGCPNILILDHYFDGAVDPVIANTCQPDGTCSVSGTPCVTSVDCRDNICLAPVCSVSGTPCAVDADCANTCITANTCVANVCTVTGGACAGNAECPNDVCSLSGERCLANADCTDPTFKVRVVTELTLVPCTQDFESRLTSLSKTVAQFLVFNEFEQRFSTSREIDCFKEFRLSNVETADNTRSIFSAGVSGTLTGQSRIRGVVNEKNAGRGGNALLGVAEEFRCAGPAYQFPLCNFVDDADLTVSTTAKNLHFQGRRPQSDFVYLP